MDNSEQTAVLQPANGQENKNQTNRNASFELLRIIMMFLIIVFHFVIHSGAENNVQMGTFATYQVKFLSVIFMCAVNVFVMISGYFMFGKQAKFSKLFKLWLPALFYCVIFCGIRLILKHSEYGLHSALALFSEQFFPVTGNLYWFLTAYVIMYVISPFINYCLQKISVKTHFIVCVLICVLPLLVYITGGFKGINSHFNAIFANTNNLLNIVFGDGHDYKWFIALYIFGAFIKRVDFNNLKIKKSLFNILLGAYCVLYLILMLVPSWSNSYLYTYNCILVILFSFAVFILFTQIKITGEKASKIINYISASCFGVYLIHENPFVKGIMYNRIFHVEKFLYKPYIGLAILIFAVVTFAVCTAIDILRRMFFGFIEKKITKK